GLGFSESQARGVNVNGEPALVGQVGFGRIASSDHALYWRGTAASAIDLHTFLGADYLASRAYGSSSTGDIVGIAMTDGPTIRPVFWERFVPTSLTLSPTSIKGGQSTTGTVRINLEAPHGGAVVSLGPVGPLVNPPGISLPATVTIPEGQKSVTFTITSQP